MKKHLVIATNNYVIVQNPVTGNLSAIYIADIKGPKNANVLDTTGFNSVISGDPTYYYAFDADRNVRIFSYVEPPPTPPASSDIYADPSAQRKRRLNNYSLNPALFAKRKIAQKASK